MAEVTIEQARTLLASIDNDGMVGLYDRAILATLAYTACRAGAVAKLGMGDFQDKGQQYVPRFQEKGGKSREIPRRHDLKGFILAHCRGGGDWR
jgi:integrase/recombinase XerD